MSVWVKIVSTRKGKRRKGMREAGKGGRTDVLAEVAAVYSTQRSAEDLMNVWKERTHLESSFKVFVPVTLPMISTKVSVREVICSPESVSPFTQTARDERNVPS
jgi:hypothetical protein